MLYFQMAEIPLVVDPVKGIPTVRIEEDQERKAIQEFELFGVVSDSGTEEVLPYFNEDEKRRRQRRGRNERRMRRQKIFEAIRETDSDS